MSERLSYPVPKSHFANIMQEVERASQYSVPTYVLRSPIKRADNMGVFEEGLAFSGQLESPHAISCVTINASPHIAPSVPVQVMEEYASKAFDMSSSLTEIVGNSSDKVAPQLVVWWERKDVVSDGTDFNALYRMDTKKRAEFVSHIDIQATRATKLIRDLKGSAMIWGSWGSSSVQERKMTGRSRGGPSNKLGHLHVTHMEETYRDLLPQAPETTVRDAMGFYSPWVMLMMDHFRSDMSFFLASAMYSKEGRLPSFTITKTKSRKIPRDKVKFYDGFDISFHKEIPFESVVQLLTSIAGHSEELYKECSKIHDAYYRAKFTNRSTIDVKKAAAISLSNFGLRPSSIQRFIDFIVTIRPTYIQLQRYKSDQTTAKSAELNSMLERYEQMRKRMKERSETNAVFDSIVYDTFRDEAEVKQIETTWPEHSSYWYLIDDYKIKGEKIEVKSFKLFPLIGTGKAGPERTLGGLINRTSA